LVDCGEVDGDRKVCLGAESTILNPEVGLLITQAPVPLLPDYGYGTQNKYNLDIVMMSLFNSKERTLNEYIELGYVIHRAIACFAREHEG